ncbi:MAG: type II toxin-antitoxin system RelE/ParE family toxin [Devosia sp.]
MRVDLSEKAVADLIAIYDFVAEQASDGIAARLIDDIEQRCMRLADAPQGGRSRDDLGPGLRTIAWRRRVTLFYTIQDDLIEVRRVFYAGQDYEKTLRDR